MKALLDEMIPPAVAVQLRSRDLDVAAVAEGPDLRTRSDSDVFAVAQLENRVMVTRDRADYLALDREYQAANRVHTGLVLVLSRIPLPAVGPLVVALDDLLSGPEPYPGFVYWL